jgi:hypothetical protein
LSARPNYILPDRIHIHGEWQGVLLVRRWRKRCAELARGPEGVPLDELRRLHKEHRLRFIDRPDHVLVIITEPSAPGRF